MGNDPPKEPERSDHLLRSISAPRCDEGQRAEERYRNLLAAIPDLMFRIRRDGTFVDYHGPDDATLWHKPEDFLGRRLDEVFPGEFARKCMDVIERTFASGKMQTFEYGGMEENCDERWEVRMTVCGPDEVLALKREITDKKRAEEELRRNEEQQRILLRELDHRVRNNLASLVALIDISARGAKDVNELAAAIRSRVQAMSTTHALLARSHLTPIDLRGLITALIPADISYSVNLAGPEVFISTRQSTALGMVVQEIVTNSIKYGSLSALGGRMEVSWQVVNGGGADEPIELELHWRETGGPTITEKPKPGVGTALIKGLVRTELRGRAELAYPASGASHRLILRLDTLEEEAFRR